MTITRESDYLYIFRAAKPSSGNIGMNIRTYLEWGADVENGVPLPGDLIVPNAISGKEAETTDGRKSLIAESCISKFTFVLVEFDSMPLKVQAAFWRGLLTKSPLAPKVVSIVYSGGKSLHGLLRVGCRTRDEWQTVRDQLRRLLATDPDPASRADEQAMRPRTGTCLPGVRRFDNGKLQRLLYLNPEAVRPTMQDFDIT